MQDLWKAEAPPLNLSLELTHDNSALSMRCSDTLISTFEVRTMRRSSCPLHPNCSKLSVKTTGYWSFRMGQIVFLLAGRDLTKL